MRTPKLECQLKFISKSATAEGQVLGRGDELSIIMDTIDESISFVLAKDKDCHVKLRKPLHVKKGNISELLLTFQSTTLSDDVIVIKGEFEQGCCCCCCNQTLCALAGQRNKAPQVEIVDGEAINWIFYKSSTVEFNELYYYY